MTPYLTEQQAINLKVYKYSGGDLGLTYIYFYNPVSRWLVEHIPEYIAPNVITLSGFMFTLVPFVNLFIRYGTNFDDEYPYH